MKVLPLFNLWFCVARHEAGEVCAALFFLFRFAFRFSVNKKRSWSPFLPRPFTTGLSLLNISSDTSFVFTTPRFLSPVPSFRRRRQTFMSRFFAASLRPPLTLAHCYQLSFKKPRQEFDRPFTIIPLTYRICVIIPDPRPLDRMLFYEFFDGRTRLSRPSSQTIAKDLWCDFAKHYPPPWTAFMWSFLAEVS